MHLRPMSLGIASFHTEGASEITVCYSSARLTTARSACLQAPEKYSVIKPSSKPFTYLPHHYKLDQISRPNPAQPNSRADRKLMLCSWRLTAVRSR